MKISFDHLSKISRSSKKFILIFGLYLIGYINLDWQWTFLLLGVWCYIKINLEQHKKTEKEEREMQSGPNQHHLPSWFLYPDTQRAEWLNLLIARLWPYFGKCLENHLKELAKQPSFVQKLQSHSVKSIHFPRISVGTIPPRIGGIGFHQSTHRDEVILDIDVNYAGDMSIQIEIHFINENLPVLPVSISNLTFAPTKSRLHLKPLLKVTPFFGAVYLSFLEVPEVDFDFDCGAGGLLANAMEFPGVSLLLRHIIRDHVQKSLVYPKYIPLPLIDEDELAELLEKKINARGEVSPLSIIPQGVLSIFVIEAKGLPKKDFKILGQGKSDPYVTMTIMADEDSHSFRSETIANTINPQWKMMVDVPIDCTKTLARDVQLQVFDEDRLGPDDFLGKCTIPAQLLRTALHSHGQYQDIWKKLQLNENDDDNDDNSKDTSDHAMLHCAIGWSELKESPPVPMTSTLDSSQHLHLGVISVYVDSCQNLGGGGGGRRTGRFELPSPKVKVTVCNVVQMTEASQVGTTNPVYEHRMNFLVHDPRADRVEFAVLDDSRPSGRDQVMATLRYPISNLLAKSNLSLSHNVLTLDVNVKDSDCIDSQIIVSMVFRFIHRPKTQGYGSHLDLLDLSKIMQLHKVQASSKEASINSSSLSSSCSQGTPAEEVNVSVISTPKVTSTPLMGNTTEQQQKLHQRRTRSSHCTPSSSPTRRPPQPRKLQTEDYVVVGKIRLSLKYNQRTATLSVIVHRLQNLQKYYQHGPNISTYVKLRLIENILPGRNHRVRHTRQRTTTQRHSFDPVFEETLHYLLPQHELKMRRLEVTVCHEGGILRSRASVLSRYVRIIENVE